MTPRQRVLAAFGRTEPDRVPKTASFTPVKLREVQEKTGCESPAEAFGFEMRHVHLERPTTMPDYTRYLPADLPPGTTISEWGLTEKPGSLYHFTEYVYPMANLRDPAELDDWPFPDPTPEYRWAGLADRVRELHEQGYFVLGSAGGIFETAWYIRSMEQLFLDMRFNQPFATRLLDEITARRAFAARKCAEAGVDAISTGDDVATQQGMMMSPPMWRTWLKPRLAQIIAAATAIKPDIHVTYHSDGNVRAVIPELAEVGVTVLNPVQPECMDVAQIKRDFGDRLAFWGGMGIQQIMPWGTAAEVRAEVKRLIETLGAGGGYLISPTHVLEPEVPWENIRAFFDAAQEYGAYS
jgi:uroporphyrinogen decarboxylase